MYDNFLKYVLANSRIGNERATSSQ